MADIMFDEDLLAAAESDPDTYTAEEFDVDADYSAPPPPAPDGWYEMELELLGAKDANGTLQAFVGPRTWGTVQKTYFTQIQGKIVAPGTPHDGKTTQRFNVTTHPEERRNSTSSADMVYKAISGRPVSMSPGTAMVQLVKEFQGAKPRVWVKTQLTGQAQNAGKEYSDAKKAGTLPAGTKPPKTYRGQKAFTDEKGKLTGRVLDDKAHNPNNPTDEIVVGQPEIVEMRPESFTPPQAK